MPIYSAGADGGNRLGRPGPGKTPAIVPIESKGVKCIAVGWRHNIVIFDDGKAVCWGDNSDFQLGLSHIGEFSRPFPLDCFPDEQIAWAHCGDKSTTFLTTTGKVYTCGLSTGRRILEIQIPKPAIYVTSGCAVSVAIDVDGAIYRANAGNVSAQRWVLPDPVCDAAVGSNFVLALTTQGQVYGIDKFAMEGTGSTTTFLPVPSLQNIQVARVFAYNEHAAVITRDGRVMMCGNGESGRLGFGDTESRNRFEFLTDLDGANIIEIDMGDASTIFIGHDGSVYGCGASADGRLMCGESTDLIVPTRSMHVPGKAVFVRCGCFHSVVLTDSIRPVHPALKFFKMTGNLVAIARSILVGGKTVNTAASSLTIYDLLPGDTVKHQKYGEGKTIGVLCANIIVSFNGTMREVEPDSIQFVTRKGYSLYEGTNDTGETSAFDGGSICSLFGFKGGSVVTGPDQKPFTVLGYAHGTVWFADDTGRAFCLKEDGLKNLHSLFRDETSKYYDTPEGNLPIKEIEPFYARYNTSIYKVLGLFGSSYLAKLVNGKIKLIPQKKSIKLQSNTQFKELDRVFVESLKENGTVLGCLSEKIIFLSDKGLVSNGKPVIIANKECTLIARFCGEGKRTVNGVEYDVSIEAERSYPYLPSDIILSKEDDSIYTVIGRKDEKLWIQKSDNGEVHPFLNEKVILLRRHFRTGHYAYPFVTKEDVLPLAKVAIAAMAGLGVLPGNEIIIEDRNYIVCGIANHCLWLCDVETQTFAGIAKQSFNLKESIKIVKDLSDNINLLMVSN
ncbi:hypothetical protein TVAG_357590 [Trichomonas vaginalis G3]|uniref:Regulator of chromosome condensation family protein n=1 Tax=Trichomonas vaginalis (strain ATCC PRA-98 / G3) TaxID=412133 RepID=A2G1E1_TRIV3|nr:ubiquitin-protein transferase protein [Trichomonas vaginalis G3]EAX89021.1 hypothetical protein TVAG_357590 [Trichomonas vaginalis G3]KAI5552914.1 ubiquitin-protein transferase protein [Trichomonas vaginalis G3]|eukprot:XP_001301951.1 hypothetical protein [Trichomonas vaginalis G3]